MSKPKILECDVSKIDFPNSSLLIPNKPDVERDAVAQSWNEAGGEVIRLDKFWEPPAFENTTTKVYGNWLFVK